MSSPSTKPADRSGQAGYVLISPVRDEIATFGCTLASVLAQSVLPSAWVVVDDGSQDGTLELVQDAVREHDFIHLVQFGQGGERKVGARVVRSLNLGLETLKDLDWDFVGKLDGDVQLPGDYYARLLAELAADPGLGIVSGSCLAPGLLGWQLERSASFHTRGPCKVWRRSCMEDIGGLLPCLGWDGLDGYAARMRGWATRALPDLLVLHFRPTHGVEGRLGGALRAGRGAYQLHYRPSYLLARAMLNPGRKPRLIGGLGLILGFLGSVVRGDERLASDELVAYIRREQKGRLLRKLTGKG